MAMTLEKRKYRMKVIHSSLKKLVPKEWNLDKPENRKYYSMIRINNMKRSNSKTYDGVCFVLNSTKSCFWIYKIYRNRVNTADIEVASLLDISWLPTEIHEWYILNMKLFHSLE